MVIAKIGGEQWGGRFPIRNDSGGSQSEIIAPVERSLSDSVFKTYFLLVERLLALLATIQTGKQPMGRWTSRTCHNNVIT